jgi:hypothetical protein
MTFPKPAAELGELQAVALAFDRAMATCDRATTEACALLLLRRWPAQGAILNGGRQRL